MRAMKTDTLAQTQRIVEVARETLRIEAAAVAALAERADEALVAVVHAIQRSPGRVIVMGMGRNHIISDFRQVQVFHLWHICRDDSGY